MELVPGIHVIDLGVVHAYLLREAGRLTLIDTGLVSSAGRILEEVAAIGAQPRDLRQIVVTHAHDDHAGALAELAERTGALVLAHAADAPVIRGERPQQPPDVTDEERELHERIARNVAPAPPARVDRELRDGDEVDVGHRAVVVEAPGHTPGSIALYLPGRGVLFTGDAVASVGGKPIVGVFNVDPARAAESFRKLAELDFEVACFGHGAPLARDACLAFRRRAERLAERAEREART